MMSSRRNMLSLIAVLTVLALFAWVSPGQTEAYTIDPEIRGGWQPGPNIYHPSRVIVRFSDAVTTNAATDSIQRLGYSVYRVADFKPTAAFPNGVRFGIIDLPPEEDIDNAITRLAVMPGILYVERDAVFYLSNPPVIPDDPLFEAMWGFDNENLPPQYVDPRMLAIPVNDADVDMPEAWANHTCQREIIVAVIDTGIYIDHPDLAANIWTNPGEIPGNGVDDDGNGYIDDVHGWDFYNNDNSVWDPHERGRDGRLNDSHGTHVAGTIGATGNNGLGVCGIHWNVRIMPLKAFGPEGGYTADTILALNYAAGHGALIANCSWGGESYSQALEDAIEASGMLVIAAAGNSGQNNDDTPQYPASYALPNIISVAASMQNDKPCDYPGWWSTCYGATSVDLFAPGGWIISTVPPDPPPAHDELPGEAYDYLSGTSMATPHVAGAAALVVDKYPDLPLYPGAPGWAAGDSSVKDVLLKTVDKKASFEGKVLTGGRLNVAHALLLNKPPVITSVSADVTRGQRPLTVTLNATAIDPDGEIQDVWWDFGDGSPPAYGFEATHCYTQDGTFVAMFHAVDDDGAESVASIEIVVLAASSIYVNPTRLECSLKWGDTETQHVSIQNRGTDELDYSIEVRPVGLIGEGYQHVNEQLWVDVRPVEGTIAPGECELLDVTFSPDGLKQGIWQATLGVRSNDPDSPEVVVDTNLHVHSMIPPIIKSVIARPRSGGPPLRVSFLANVEDCDGQVVDVLWDFGDGSDSISGTLTPEHIYVVEGEYDATLTVTDDDGLSESAGVHIIARPVPRIEVTPKVLNPAIRAHRTHTENLTITNEGYADLAFVLQAELAGSDETGHEDLAEDSEEMDEVWLWLNPNAGTIASGESAEIMVVFDLGAISNGELDASIVLESNDVLQPEYVVPVCVEVIENQAPVITACGVNPRRGCIDTTFEFAAVVHDEDGNIVDKYWEFGDGTSLVHELAVSHNYGENGTYTAVFHAIDNDGYETTATVDVSVEDLPKASWSPSHFSFRVPRGQEASGSLLISNAGPGTFVFGDVEYENVASTPMYFGSSASEVDPCRLTNENSSAEHGEASRSHWLPDEVGNIILNWPCPEPILSCWGVCVDKETSNLVIGDARQRKDSVVTTAGEYTGVSWSTPWAGDWPADMTFDGEHIWQVSVGGDNSLYCLDAQNGDVVSVIGNTEWTKRPQLSVTHNPSDDTFYIGGWHSNCTIYHIKGNSWDHPGEVLRRRDTYLSISGLAYHPSANVLAVATNANPDMIYFMNPESFEVLAEFPHPAHSMGYKQSGAGIDFDAKGNLWIASQLDNTMYVVETGLGPISECWLRWDPEQGTLPAGLSQEIAVTVRALDYDPGIYRSSIVIFTNDIECPMVHIPVTMQVTQLPSISQATAEPRIGDPPLTVSFRAVVEETEVPIAAFRWDFGDGAYSPSLDAVHMYSTPGIYTATFMVVDELGGFASRTVAVEAMPQPVADVDPSHIEVTLPSNVVRTETITVGNVDGKGDLDFAVRLRPGASVPQQVAFRERTAFECEADAYTSEGLYVPLDIGAMSIDTQTEKHGVGDVILSWRTPEPIDLPFGLAYDGTNLWVSDPRTCTDHMVTPQGTHTGRSFTTPWVTNWPGGMVYDARRDVIWQLNVGGNCRIYGVDPHTGQVVHQIRSTPWVTAQFGLAYNSDDDTFYVGGWDEDMIYHIAGPDWQQPGAVLQQWHFPVGISGLAWHPDGVLWVASNGSPDMIYAVDPISRAVIHQFIHPAVGAFNGAGIAVNSDGNLWVASQGNSMIYMINTCMPIVSGVTIEPMSGVVAAGERQELVVTIDASRVGAAGEDVHGHLQIHTSDHTHPVMYVDIVTHILPSPSIIRVEAEPVIGEPPLEVAFTAVVVPGSAPITEVWWDFGDDSELVHDTVAVHTYSEAGTYHASIHVVDDNDVEVTESVDIVVAWLPTLEVTPETLDVTVAQGTQAQRCLRIRNCGNAPLTFQVGPAPSFQTAEAGGPDNYGYIWMDSDQLGGPVFEWIEIKDVGTRIPLGDESGAIVDLPFEFPFYGDVKTEIGITSNGYLCFDGSLVGLYFLHAPIPDARRPNDMIAAFWTDLDPGTAGSVYCYYDEPHDRFIVEYEDVTKWDPWSPPASFTFQIILKPDGTIVYQYLRMIGDLVQATIGIEDALGLDGLEVAHNIRYVENELAVAFSPLAALIDVHPSSGYLLPGGSQDVVVTVGSPHVAPGTYSFLVFLASNDPFHESREIPVRIKVNQVPSAGFLSPAGGVRWAGKQEITWTARDPDDDADELLIDLYWSRDGGQWNEIAKGLANTGSYLWNTAEVGLGGDEFRVRIVVTDPAGETAEAISEAFTILNDAPVAEFGFAPSKPTVSDVVEFVDASTDDGEIVAWHWEFGDGVESFEQNPKHQYTAKGKFTVKLTVTDDGGLTGVCEKQIQVVNVAPEVKILKPEAGEIWTGARTIEYEATDADGDVLAIKLEYDSLGDDAGWQLIADGEENTGKYLWDTSKLSWGGIYKVRVTASDPDGGTAQDVSDEFTIVVLKRMVMVAPNPARDLVTFYYDIDTDGELFVYDVAGRLVHTAKLSATANSHEWNLTTGGRPVASGLYLYVVVTDDVERSEVGRLVIERL